jgi:hypothetical protein
VRLLLAAAAVLVCACGRAQDAPPLDVHGLTEILQQRSYAGCRAEPAPHPSSGPHGRVRVFFNDAMVIFLDVYLRRASFEPRVKNLQQRLFDAYAAEVARVDLNGDGIISAVEGDADTSTDGFADNSRLYLSPTVFERFAVTREINDGLLAPRFSPSQRAWVLSGTRVPVSPPVPASAGRRRRRSLTGATRPGWTVPGAWSCVHASMRRCRVYQIVPLARSC